jgi:enoyl-CoA hydratase/carnithine racemase
MASSASHCAHPDSIVEPMRVSDLRLLLDTPFDHLVESTSVLQTPEPVVLEARGDLDDASTTRLAAILRRLPAPTVLLGGADASPGLVHAVDVCVTSGREPARPFVSAEVDEVAEAVRRQPLASLALVALLRSTETLDSWNGVAMESATYSMLLGSAPFAEWLARRGPPRRKPVARPPVRVERVDDVLRVTLDRPEARNAIDSAMRDDLVEALRLAVADPRVTVEIRGSGPSFSAGGDLEEFGTVGDPATADAVRLTRHPGLALDAVAARTTCVVHGPCVGAGVEIAAFAGSVRADPGTTFRLPEVSMGLVPGAGGTVSIPRRIGRQRAGWLALTGAVLECQVARTWGLVDEVVSPTTAAASRS